MRLRAGVAAVACLVTVACTPTGPVQPSPSPTPVPTRSETAVEREQRVAYEAAEQAYRAEVAEMDRLLAKGGSSTASAVLKSVAAGPYLSREISLLRAAKAAGERAKGNVRVLGFERRGFSQTELLLRACVDGRQALTLDRDGKVIERGLLITESLTVRSIASRWKIWQSEVKEVTACP